MLYTWSSWLGIGFFFGVGFQVGKAALGAVTVFLVGVWRKIS